MTSPKTSRREEARDDVESLPASVQTTINDSFCGGVEESDAIIANTDSGIDLNEFLSFLDDDDDDDDDDELVSPPSAIDFAAMRHWHIDDEERFAEDDEPSLDTEPRIPPPVNHVRTFGEDFMYLYYGRLHADDDYDYDDNELTSSSVSTTANDLFHRGTMDLDATETSDSDLDFDEYLSFLDDDEPTALGGSRDDRQIAAAMVDDHDVAAGFPGTAFATASWTFTHTTGGLFPTATWGSS